MKNTNKMIVRISLILSFISIFVEGLAMNMQNIGDLKKFAGGFPFIWFEIYYAETKTALLEAILQNGILGYRVELFCFFVNTVIYYYVIYSFKKYIKRLQHHRKN